MNEAFAQGFFDELLKIAVYKPPGVPSLSSMLPGKIPQGRVGKLLGNLNPNIRKRMAAAKELKTLRQKGPPEDRPTLKERYKRWKGDPLGLFSGIREWGTDKPAERRRAGRRHLAGLRAQAAGEPYARGVAKQEQINAPSADRRLQREGADLINFFLSGGKKQTHEERAKIKRRNQEISDALKKHLEERQDPSDWWKHGKQPPGFRG